MAAKKNPLRIVLHERKGQKVGGINIKGGIRQVLVGGGAVAGVKGRIKLRGNKSCQHRGILLY